MAIGEDGVAMVLAPQPVAAEFRREKGLAPIHQHQAEENPAQDLLQSLSNAKWQTAQVINYKRRFIKL